MFLINQCPFLLFPVLITHTHTHTHKLLCAGERKKDATLHLMDKKGCRDESHAAGV